MFSFKSVLKLFFVGLAGIGLTNFASEKKDASKTQTRNIIMLLDSGAGESIFNSNAGFGLGVFHAALDYGKSPIVVSGSILHSFFENAKKFSMLNTDVQKAAMALHKKFGGNPCVSLSKAKMLDKISDLLSQQAECIKKNGSLRSELIAKKIQVLRKQLDDNQETANKFNDKRCELILKFLNKSEFDKESAEISMQLLKAESELTAKYKEQIDQIDAEIAEIERDLNTVDNKQDSLKQDLNNNDLVSKATEVKDSYDPYFQSFASWARLNKLQNFNIYKCVGTHEYLLIPRILPDEQTKSSFMITDSHILVPITLNDLQQDVYQAWGHNRLHTLSNICSNKFTKAMVQCISNIVAPLIDQARWYIWALTQEVNWHNLKKIFVLGSDNWIIYLGGHGWYTPMQQQENKGFNVNHFKDLTNIVTTAAISGLSIADHNDFMKTIGSTIKSLAMYEMTCFGGGYNLQQSVNFLKSLENQTAFSPYLYICGCLTDTSPRLRHDIDTFNFAQFFKAVQDTCNAIQHQISSKDKKLSEIMETCKEGIRAVSADKDEIDAVFSSPSYYMAGMKDSQLLDMYDCISCITPDQKGDIEIDDKKAIAIYGNKIQCKLKIGTKRRDYTCPHFVSMNIGTQIHRIESIEIPVNFRKFLIESMYGFKEIAKKIYYFSKLSTCNYYASGFPGFFIYLEDVIIVKDRYMQARGFTGAMKVVGTVYCKIQGQERYFKANVDGSYKYNVPAIISPFQSITKAEFDAKKAELIS